MAEDFPTFVICPGDRHPSLDHFEKGPGFAARHLHCLQ